MRPSSPSLPLLPFPLGASPLDGGRSFDNALARLCVSGSLGRRRPWLFAGLLPCAITYTAIFFSPELIGIELDTQGKVC